tara:strand:+ start:198 stop:425 length:228 start_codon:yes stop_codon:yes gene_type:complete
MKNVNKDYVNISASVMINVYECIRKDDKFKIDIGWLYDLTDQIEWSLKLMKENNDKDYEDYKYKYDMINIVEGEI